MILNLGGDRSQTGRISTSRTERVKLDSNTNIQTQINLLAVFGLFQHHQPIEEKVELLR